MIHSTNKVSGIVKSISVSQGVNPDTHSALLAVQVRGISVPVYMTVDNVNIDKIPDSGERIKVKYNIYHNKIYLKSYRRSNGQGYIAK